MAAKTKGYKFATLKAEAAKKSEGREKRKAPPPFVIEDVEPPIEITAPDTVERQLMIGELIGRDGTFNVNDALPLLRALCGPAFGRVWMLVKNDTEPDVLIALVQAMTEHFSSVIEAEAGDLPGGSAASSS